MRVHQVLATLGYGDAIGHEVLGIQRVLRAAGYEWTAVLLKPDDLVTKSAVEFKATERKKLVDQGYTVIVNVGDQMSDLEGGHAERTYKLPNPFYFIP